MGGTELLIASAVMSGVQGFAGYQQAQAQAKTAQQTANYNSQLAAQQSATEKAQLLKQQRLMASTARVRGAGSGASLGSFEDVYESNKTQSLLDIALLDYESNVKQDQINYSGQVEVSQAKAKGVNSLISGLSGAGSSMSKVGGSSSSYTSNKTGETVYWR